MKTTRAIHIALLFTLLACTIGGGDADATAVGLSAPSAVVPAPLPFVVPSPSPSPSLLHAVVVHGWTDESRADPPVNCSLSVAAWRTADSDADADADADGGGSQSAGDSNRAARGHWLIQQRWRMRSPALILKLTPLHTSPSSLHSVSAKALALPQPGAAWPSPQPLGSSRWLLQLRCATAAGRRIAALPERGIQVDAVRHNLNTHEGWTAGADRVAGVAGRERSASLAADPAPLSLSAPLCLLLVLCSGRRGRQPLRAAATIRRRGRLSAPPAAPSAGSAVAAAAAARRNQPAAGGVAARV